MASNVSRMSKESEEVRNALADQTLSYVTAALSVVAGLAWNDAVKSAIDLLFPTDATSLAAKFLYAVVMTIVVVLLTLALRRIIGFVKPHSHE